MSETNERYQQFLIEYEAICQKYGLRLDSCGCCGSPWPVVNSDTDMAEHMEHLRTQKPDKK